MKLTSKQRKFLNTLEEFIKEEGYTPTVREIGDIAYLNSPATVKYYLDKLEKGGYIKRINNRKIEFIDWEKEKEYEYKQEQSIQKRIEERNDDLLTELY